LTGGLGLLKDYSNGSLFLTEQMDAVLPALVFNTPATKIIYGRYEDSLWALRRFFKHGVSLRRRSLRTEFPRSYL